MSIMRNMQPHGDVAAAAAAMVVVTWSVLLRIKKTSSTTEEVLGDSETAAAVGISSTCSSHRVLHQPRNTGPVVRGAATRSAVP